LKRRGGQILTQLDEVQFEGKTNRKSRRLENVAKGKDAFRGTAWALRERERVAPSIRKPYRNEKVEREEANESERERDA